MPRPDPTIESRSAFIVVRRRRNLSHEAFAIAFQHAGWPSVSHHRHTWRSAGPIRHTDGMTTNETPATTDGLSAASLPARLAAGEAALAAGRHREAAELLQPVADALPAHLGVARMVASAWQLAGARHRARAALHPVAVAIAADALIVTDDDAYALGAQLLDAGGAADALALFQHIQRKRSANAALLGALATAHRALGALDEAWALAQRAVVADKKNPALLLTAAQIRHAQGAFDDALAWLKKAEAVRPFHAPTRLQRALTRLLQRPTRHGWEDFEHRGLPTLPAGTVAWRGDALDGRPILVIADQGLGDLFHFVRFTTLLVARGASRVVIAAPASTVTLLRASGFDAIADGGTAEVVASLGGEVLAVPLLSLPARLGIEGETLGELVPYLGVREGRRRQAAGTTDGGGQRPRVGGHKPRLGLVLHGNPDYLTTHLRDADASVASALADVPDVQWVWLQMGEAPPDALAGIEQPAMAGDWLETARLVDTLDGVVSVDTGMAHLTGAMGVPLHVLLPYTPDWRWGWQGSTTAWYPTAVLHRQTAPADWAGAVASLRRALVI